MIPNYSVFLFQIPNSTSNIAHNNKDSNLKVCIFSQFNINSVIWFVDLSKMHLKVVVSYIARVHDFYKTWIPMFLCCLPLSCISHKMILGTSIIYLHVTKHTSSLSKIANFLFHASAWICLWTLSFKSFLTPKGLRVFLLKTPSKQPLLKASRVVQN